MSLFASIIITLSAVVAAPVLVDCAVRWRSALGDALQARAAHERSRTSRLRHTVGIAIAGEGA